MDNIKILTIGMGHIRLGKSVHLQKQSAIIVTNADTHDPILNLSALKFDRSNYINIVPTSSLLTSFVNDDPKNFINGKKLPRRNKK